MVFPEKVIGRHLRQARQLLAFCWRDLAERRHLVARLDEGDVVALSGRHHFAGAGSKLVDVELVVGEQHEVLEVAWRRRRIVLQAMQGIVDARRCERGKRQRFADLGVEGAVDDGIVGDGEVGHIEHVAQRTRQRVHQRPFHISPLVEGEVQRDRQ